MGDVIGYPALAEARAEQGRLAACHMFGVSAEPLPAQLPFGVHAIPEIGWLGASEADQTTKGVP